VGTSRTPKGFSVASKTAARMPAAYTQSGAGDNPRGAAAAHRRQPLDRPPRARRAGGQADSPTIRQGVHVVDDGRRWRPETRLPTSEARHRAHQSKGAPVNRDDLCYESTVSLARRIRAGEVSPLQAVNAYLERIERVDPRVHSYLHVAADHAVAAARRAEQALAERRALGPLHGVPLAVKDLFDTAGIPTTCGSPRIL